MKPYLLVVSALKLFSLDPSHGTFISTLHGSFPHRVHFSSAAKPVVRRLVVAKTARESEGVFSASCALPSHTNLLWGSDQNAGYITQEIADRLQDRKFSNFGNFRKAFWKAVSRSSHSNEFTPDNQERMASGRAPIAPESQQLQNKSSYVLHHILPLHQDGEVYDPCNLMIVTPRYHEEVLMKDYHFSPTRSS